MKKYILLFLIAFGVNSLFAQINNNVENPTTAPNSGVQTPAPGVQTTGPDFQPATPYMQTVPTVTTPNTPGQLVPSTQTTTPQIQTQPNITSPNSSGTDNSIYTTPSNTLTPGAPISPPKNNY